MHWLASWVAGVVVVISGACGGLDASGAGTPAGTGGSTGAPGEGTTAGPGESGLDGTTADGGPEDTGSTTMPASVCGDGILEGTEECDDGNRIDGDGCDADCTPNLDTSIWEDVHPGDAMVRESGQGIAVDSSGNIVVGGYEVDAVGNPNLWIAKYDPDGGQRWAVALDPSMGLDDRVYGVAIDPDDEIVLVGDSDTAPSSSVIWVGKLDSDGNELWSTTFDGPQPGNDGGRGVTSDAEGNVVITGFLRVANNDNDIFVAKLDRDGAELWTETVAGPDVLDDRGQALVADPEGNTFVAGYLSQAGFDRNVWLRKYDPDGVELWTETWDSPTSADDAGFGITRAPDGSVVVAGMTPVVADNQDIWLGRWDADGSLLWWRQFGGQAYVNDQGLAVAADAESNFVVVGFRGVSATDSDIWMRKYDVGGNVQWSQVVAGRGNDRDQATAVATDTNLDIVVTGEIREAMSNDGDIWVGKFGPG